MPGHSGQGGGQQQQQQPTGSAYGNNQPTQINQSSSFYIGDQNQTFSGVIPILMPPGRNPFHIIIIITNTINKHLQSVSLDKRLVMMFPRALRNRLYNCVSPKLRFRARLKYVFLRLENGRSIELITRRNSMILTCHVHPLEGHIT